MNHLFHQQSTLGGGVGGLGLGEELTFTGAPGFAGRPDGRVGG